MTDYIRLLLEEQEDGESGSREEESWRAKEEGLALPLPAVGEESAWSGRDEAGYVTSTRQERHGETEEEDIPSDREGLVAAAGQVLSGEQESAGEAISQRRATPIRTEEEGEPEGAPSPLWQLWSARWLEADPEGKAGRPLTEVREETARTDSDRPEEYEEESAWRGTDWLELEVGPVSLGPEEPGGGRSGEAAAEWTYQALRASLAGLPAPPRETRVVTLQKPTGTSGSGGLDPEGLDRLLRRDARRFDGGFQLL